MALRAVQVIPKAREVAEQQLFAQGDEAEFSDDTFLDFKYVRAFFESTTAGAAIDFMFLHVGQKRLTLKNVELICPERMHSAARHGN